VWSIDAFRLNSKPSSLVIDFNDSFLKLYIMSIKSNLSEGPVAKTIEGQTAKLPSDLFLWASLGAMATSATLRCFGKKHDALFIGQWAAPFLLLGIYNKIVKTQGHDAADNGNESPSENPSMG
jgi:hypothetical protein